MPTYEIQLWRHLDRDFLQPKLSPKPGPLKVIGVARQRSAWEVTLKGQWTEKLTLNDKFDITNMVRLD